MAKLQLGLLFGGRSVEHEVSILSATSIARALDPARYDLLLIGIDREGQWFLGSSTTPSEVFKSGRRVFPARNTEGPVLLALDTDGERTPIRLDIVFPIVHGGGGEDGRLQGLLESIGVPYVGTGVLGSALQMDKEVAKRLLKAAGLPVVSWTTVHKFDLEKDGAKWAERILHGMQPPLFVKPANSGSSVGIAKVERSAELLPALLDAARYDTKILVERAVSGREIEVAVIGNERPEASLPGEIRPKRTFYDYRAKYLETSTELLVPAPLSEKQASRVHDLAIFAYHVLEGRGFGRVDFFFEETTDTFYVNEVNSLPGFTDLSMFPRLWQASGLPYAKLIDRLVELAFEHHREQSRLEIRPSQADTAPRANSSPLTYH